MRTFAPDGEPVCGYDPQIEGFFWLAGQGGYGIQSSPGLVALCGSIGRAPGPLPADIAAQGMSENDLRAGPFFSLSFLLVENRLRMPLALSLKAIIYPGRYFMKRIGMFASALLLSTMLAGAVQAKSLVYCSEGSPENFTPAMNTTGTSLDAARPVYNKLVQFTPGTTQVEPGLAESYEVSADGKTITFNLRKGVKFHSGVNGFTPTRDFNADDVIWSFERQWKPDHPYAKVSGGAYDYFNDMGMPDLLEVDRRRAGRSTPSS